jgi:hypothetical protein
MLCATLSYFFIGVSPNIWVYYIGAFLVGTTSALCPMGYRNELQMVCERDTIGRTISSVRFLVVLARLFGTVIISFCINEKYIRYTYIVVATILLFTFISIKKNGLLKPILNAS